MPVARGLWFAGRLAVVLLAVANPIAHVAEELFTAHVLQRILLSPLAVLAIVLGLTGPVLAPLLSAGDATNITCTPQAQVQGGAERGLIRGAPS